MHETHTQPEPAHTETRPKRTALVLVSLITFLLPVFVVPFVPAPLQFSKTLVVVVVVALLYALAMLTSMRRGEVVKYWSLPLVAFSILPLVYLVTALFSQSPARSFFGYQLETDTFGFMLLAVLLTNAVVLLVQRTHLTALFKAALAAAWAVFVFQLVQLVFGLVSGQGLVGSVTTNTVGRWNDFGMFAGLVGVLSLLALFVLQLKKRTKAVLTVTYVAALLFLIVVNLAEAWVLFGVVSFGLAALIGARALSADAEKGALRALTLPVVGVVAALFFGFVGGGVAGALQDTFSITTLTVRPSVTGTVEVLQKTYHDTPVLGSGPNTFAAQWLTHRNSGVLNTIFWNTEFSVGSGTIPTAFVTGGVVTALAWILFTFLICAAVLRALFASAVTGARYAPVVLSGTAVLYLLAMHYVYAPSQSLTLLFALSLGAFFVALKDTPLMGVVHLRMARPHFRSAMMVGATAVLVLALVSVYGVSRTYASALYHEYAIRTANTGDLERGGALISRALALRAQDRYYRTATQIHLARLNQLVNEETSEAATQAFQNHLSQAVQRAQAAVAWDATSFQNWLTLASVYTSVVPLTIDGALTNARATLEEARLRSPQSPEIDYRLAQIAMVAEDDADTARTYLAAALEKKQDYTGAILLLAQIELSQGNLAEAITSVRAAVYFEPTNPVLLYQLGILLLQDQNYEEAAQAFEIALSQQPDYSNAAFFLAQSYAFLDRIDEAAQLMAQVAARNPDSDLARTYADALAAGDNPFSPSDVASPDTDEDAVE